jgi:hypothetical protein
MAALPSGDGIAPASAKFAHQPAPMPSTASRRTPRKGFLSPLLVTCALLVVIVAAGVLEYIWLAP